MNQNIFILPKYDNHMMEYDKNLLSTLEKFLYSLN